MRALVSLAAVMAGLGLAAGTAQAAGSAAPTSAPALRVALGAEVTTPDLANPARMGLVDDYFTSISPNASFKWTTTEGQRGTVDLSSAEQFVDIARSAGLTIHAGALVWDHAGHYPAYLASDYQAGGKAAVAADVKEHITQVMSEFVPGGRYAGVVTAWNVVNEPLAYAAVTSKQVPSMSAGKIFDQSLGSTRYIAKAFRDAYAVDPTATLCLNEDGVTGISPRSTFFYNLVTKLLDRGVPLNCVGFETHVQLSDVLSGLDTQAKIEQNFARYARLRTTSGQPLNLQITELDVRLPDNGVTPVSATLLQQQALAYRAVVNGCLSVPTCTSVTTWGVDDGNSWVPAQYHNCPLPTAMLVASGQMCGSALLFDANYLPKPAYTAVAQALTTGTAAANGTSPSR